MSRKRWKVCRANTALAAEIAERFDLEPITCLIMASRGIINDEDIYEFLSDTPEFQNPFIFADMDKAVSRISQAIANSEKIAVYGDYDADGITATTLLYKYFRSKNADVVWYVPERSEGYGLNNGAIDKLFFQGVKLIVTVDNGISALSQAEHIYSLGMELVVTDHHEPPEVFPRAFAIVNPHRADCPSVFKDYAGVGVAFKLVCALENADDSDTISLLYKYGEYITIGTVGDIVPLKGENRVFVKYGTEIISNSSKPDIIELKLACGLKQGTAVTSEQVAFMFAPRVNASGRMGFAREAMELFLCEDRVSAQKTAQSINLYNYERRRVENEVFNLARQKAEDDGLVNDRVIVVCGSGWHDGVLGIVSAKLTEFYGKPSVVLNEHDGVAHGSCRSVDGFKIFDAVRSAGDILDAYGGHSMAAGLKLRADRVDELRERLNLYAKTRHEYMPFSSITIDCKLSPNGLSPEIPEGLKILEPFGAENPMPTFGLFKMRIDGVFPVSGGKYSRVTLSRNGASVNAICFYSGADGFPFVKGDIIDAAVRLEKSTFPGSGGLSVRIEDMRISGDYEEEMLLSKRIYEKFVRGETMTQSELENIIPERQVLAAVYRYIKNSSGFEGDGEMLYHRLGREFTVSSVLTSVDVLAEMGILSVEANGDLYKISLLPKCEKRNLENSEILKRLQNSKSHKGHI